MDIKNIGLVIVGNTLKFTVLIESKLKALQAEQLTKEFIAVFNRLQFTVEIIVNKESKVRYRISKKLFDYMTEIPTANYIDWISRNKVPLEEILDTMGSIEEEILRFESIQRITNVSI